MEQRTEPDVSPYRAFSRAEWAKLREDTPMTLEPAEITRLRSLHDRLDISEVEEIYLPLSRLLSLYVAATQRLFRAQQGFLGTEDARMPYIIGVGGSVAAGKSTTARVLQALLARWPNVPKVDLITTDGFLYPNAVLEREGLMEKGAFRKATTCRRCCAFFPTSRPAAARSTRRFILTWSTTSFRTNGSRSTVRIFWWSKALTCSRPAVCPKTAKQCRSCLIFSISRDISTLTKACCCRGTSSGFSSALRGTAFADPKSYFHRYARLSDEQAVDTATLIWNRINLVNLRENILPTRPRADLILKKGESHEVEEVALRRL